MSIDTFEASKIVEAMACMARIEAMKIENASALAQNIMIPYRGDAFRGEAYTLESISGLLLERSRYG